MARHILLDTLWRQAALLALIAAVVVWVVQRATRPVRQLGAALAARSESDLSALSTQDAPQELLPHAIGDKLLMAVAAQMKMTPRETDTVARSVVMNLSLC